MPNFFSNTHTYTFAALLAALGLLSGCDSTDDLFGEDEPTPRPRTELSSPEQPRQTETLADVRLKSIQDAQDKLFAELEADPYSLDEAEYQRRLQTIATQYDSFILDNPDYAYGLLLYGKFLRRTGRTSDANLAFMRANSLVPDMAVAKQQIGNFLVEEGEYGLALPYYLSAIELEPSVAIYRYQLGELLYQYRSYFIESDKLDAVTLDQNMLEAFAKAVELDPTNREYRTRYAEAFFDVQQPDWHTAMAQWDILEVGAENDIERDLIKLQQARVLIELGYYADAQKVLESVTRPSLAEARAELEARTRTGQ